MILLCRINGGRGRRFDWQKRNSGELAAVVQISLDRSQWRLKLPPQSRGGADTDGTQTRQW